MTDPLPLVDVVRELTQATSHAETYEHDKAGTTVAVTPRPSLIAQLETAMLTSSTAESGARAGYGSKPSARLDALDALIRIDQGATRWLHRLEGHGEHLTLRRSIVNLPTERLVQKVAASGLGDERLEVDIRAWWLHAKIVTGWETPPFRPNNTCPVCHKRGGLRARIDRDTSGTLVKHALCVECKTTWSHEDDSFDRLAWHIRVENNDDVDTRVGVRS